MVPVQKRCTKCAELKPSAEFYTSGPGGRPRARCKACANADCKSRRDRSPEDNKVRCAAWASANAERKKAAARVWYRENAEEVKARTRARALADPEGKRASDKAAYLANRAERLAAMRAWAAAHPAEFREYKARRRAAKLRATPGWADRGAIRAVYAEAVARGLEVDHIVPLRSPVVSGLHCEANLQLLSVHANRSKGNRTWPDMP